MKKLLFLLLEITIGIVLISLLFFMGINKFKEDVELYPTYNAKFNDINGISIGSPVKFMGLEVGNVIKIELEESIINITFRLLDKTTEIPKDAVVRIQFSGLGGSKSLEIMPSPTPIEKENKDLISLEPIRINSVIEAQTVISEFLSQFYRGINNFLETKGLEPTREEVYDASSYIKEKTEALNSTFDSIKNSGDGIIKDTKNIKSFLDTQNKNVNYAYQSVNKILTDEKVQENINITKKMLSDFSTSIHDGTTTKNIDEFSNKLKAADGKLTSFNQKIGEIKEKETHYLSTLNESLGNFSQKLESFINFSEKKDEPKPEN